jgi:hypothetical protein
LAEWLLLRIFHRLIPEKEWMGRISAQGSAEEMLITPFKAGILCASVTYFPSQRRI